MWNRPESLFAKSALALLLALTLMYGCRAFDPEPVIVNRAPETFIIGSPAETTGTRFLRHLYWYGTDADGEVVRFIYAITDSTVQDIETDDVDEEDLRFNPALDITTLLPEPGRSVGFTTRTDSIFLFEIDRGSTPSKDVTFHLVAVDDRGDMDPTPARLRFTNNSLGNPTFKFTVQTEELDGGGQPFWHTRWVGDISGPDIDESPELSDLPFVGFGRKFRVQWEASSPNGAINGYRYKADQNANVGYTPPSLDGGVKVWDPALVGFEYANNAAPSTLTGCFVLPNGLLSEEAFCDPAEVRWPSDRYVLLVEAQDVALVESEQIAGQLRFNVNYPPETILTQDANYPSYEGNWDNGESGIIAEGDTLPWGSWVTFEVDGFDRTVDTVAPDTYGEFCCDDILVTGDVTFQVRYDAIRDEGNNRPIQPTNYSTPFTGGGVDPDTLGFQVGPMDHQVAARALDEHRRPDPTPETFEFVAGLQPRMIDVLPANDDLWAFSFAAGPRWPESLPFETESQVRYWNGSQYLTADPCEGLTGDELDDCEALISEVNGNIFIMEPRFEGRAHPREPAQAIKAWTFAWYSDHDPLNLVIDGFESKDLSFFYEPGTLDVWQLDRFEDEGIEIFIPDLFFFARFLYEPTSPNPAQRSQGEHIARRLGMVNLAVQGRNTSASDTWAVYPVSVRPDPFSSIIQVPLGDAGRRTAVIERRFRVYIGFDEDSNGSLDLLWPNFPFEDY